MEFGDRLKQLRLERKLTQKDIASYFNVTTDYLLGLSEDDRKLRLIYNEKTKKITIENAINVINMDIIYSYMYELCDKYKEDLTDEEMQTDEVIDNLTAVTVKEFKKKNCQTHQKTPGGYIVLLFLCTNGYIETFGSKMLYNSLKSYIGINIWVDLAINKKCTLNVIL